LTIIKVLLVAAKLRERLLVIKRVAQKFDMHRFDLRKLNDAEVKEQYQVKISNSFAALGNCDDTVDMSRAWENIRENMKTSAKESLGHYDLQQRKPWFDDECSKLIDRRKQAKLQWLQNPSQVNGDNMENVRHEASRTFRTKKREYLNNKINELETNSKNKNIRDLYRGINKFKKGYQPRTNMVKAENGDLLADSHSILNRWKNYFCQLVNVHGVTEVRHTERHTAEPLVSEHSSSEFEIAIEKINRYKSPGIDQIPAELIHTLRSEIHKLINCIWDKEELPEQWKESIIVPIYKKGDRTDCSNYRGISLLSTAYKILTNILLSRLTPYADEIIGDHQCGFRCNRSTTVQIFCIRQILEKKMGVQ
jgi:hypothetical protein